MISDATTGQTQELEPKVSSRRNMLRLAGAAAVGVAGAAVIGGQQASAANGDDLVLGTSNAAATVTTLLGSLQTTVDTATAVALTGYGATLAGTQLSTADDGLVRAGVLGVSARFLGSSTPRSHGVVGLATIPSAGSGVYGNSDASVVGASAGLRARSVNGPAVQLVPVATGAPTTGTWGVGAIQPDTAGNLWYCIASGTPGTWRNLAAAPVAAAAVATYHPITPGRVYDSRAALPQMGVLNNGSGRLVTVANKRDVNGAVVTADFVPAGATAITCNLTVVNTVNSGFLTVLPGGTAFDVNTATAAINWFGTAQILNNGITLTLNANRELSIYAGGGGNTDFVIDVSGYYL